jgi:hypothetical protein
LRREWLVDATLKLPRALVKIFAKQIPASKYEMAKQYTMRPTNVGMRLALWSSQHTQNKTAIFEVIKIYSKFFGRLEFSGR